MHVKLTMHIPTEVYQTIIRVATCVPEAFDTSFDSVLHEDQESVQKAIQKSMFTKTALSLVFKLFHELTEESLYEIVTVNRFDHIPYLAKLLQSQPNRHSSRKPPGLHCRRLEISLGTGAVNYKDKAWSPSSSVVSGKDGPEDRGVAQTYPTLPILPFGRSSPPLVGLISSALSYSGSANTWTALKCCYDIARALRTLTEFMLALVKNGRDPRTPSPSRSGAVSSAASSPERPAGPLGIAVAPGDREVVKVNNSNPTELKHACDDALKRYLSRPDLFKQIHLHTDVRLGLGWLSVFIAAGTALYGYKIDFEKSKPVVWAGLLLYIALTTIQTLYAYFIEGNIVFVGKRKTFSKRIITERITLSSTTEPVKKTNPPAYSLSLHYVRSTSGGKSLLAKGKTRGSKGYNAFFDAEGTLDQERFEQWVGELVERVMEGKRS
ncbi:hypothetical protein D9615_006946 [Tricholomella constricta]|uniref:Signal peptidase complex subunit 2 n=1 Tax=Tricholomella constricta TaxID=117010 RepID=A0A8H5H9C2_9AGAR|nr:hypothetical protein D9615_006946 [Tricholomella constricta]